MSLFDIATVRIDRIVDCCCDLFETELRYARQFSAKRRLEFISGRSVARKALEQIGIAGCAIGVDRYRRPIWPAGVTGSISHCDRLVGAAVMAAKDAKAIGLDLEAEEAVTIDLWETILRPAEKKLIETHGNERLATVLFSCKEAVFKAVNPITDEFFDFLDVEITLTRSIFHACCVTKNRSSQLIADGIGEYEIKDGVVRSIFVVS